MTIAAIVLAAGTSRRLGRPKQLVRLQGEPLVARAVRTAAEAGLSPILVVVSGFVEIEQVLKDLPCVLLQNPGAAEGMASSVRVGVGALLAEGSVQGAVLMTCDQPGVTWQHLRRLCAEPARMTGSGYGGRVGVPAYLPASTFPALQQLRGDVGARKVLQDAAVIFEEALALDVDTEADVQQAEAQFGTGPSA